MSSGTLRQFAKKEDLKKLADNVAIELNNQKTQSFSLAICFDALLAVLDKRFPVMVVGSKSISEELRENLSAKRGGAMEPVATVLPEQKAEGIEDKKSDV